MKVIIFGASGTVGRHLVEQALDKGYEVTAFTRNSANITKRHSNLRIVEGDVLDASAVEAAVSGHEAVFCVIGAGRNATLRSSGTAQIINAMQQTGVKRLICQTSLGAGDSHGTLNFFWKHIMFGLLLRGAFKDHGRQEALVFKSELDWTIVRPGAFTDGALTGEYQYGFPGTHEGLSLKISRADVAHFLLRQAIDERFLNKAVSVCY